MAYKAHMTGMLGVYLVAAELTNHGFIVSPTSRSAAGADLLVTDEECDKAWSVQVKTNAKPANFWLVSQRAERMKSESHVYVFVNIKGKERPEYLVVPSSHVAEHIIHETTSKGSEWYSFMKSDRLYKDEGWSHFGNPHIEAITADEAETIL